MSLRRVIAQLDAEIEAIETAFDDVRSAVLARTDELKQRDRRTHALMLQGFTEALQSDFREALPISKAG